MRSIAFAACVVLTTACTDGTGPGGAAQTAIHLTPATVRGSDSTIISLRLTNRSPWPLTFHGSPGCLVTHRITDMSGTVVRTGPSLPCPAVLMRITLQSGESQIVEYAWSPAGGRDALPVGQYLVRAGIDAVETRGFGAPSSPVLLTLLPPQESH